MSKNFKIILGILGAIVLLIVLWYFSTLITYIVISAILSIIGAPIVYKLKKIKVGYIHISSGIAALITLFLMVGVLVALFSIFAPLVSEEAEIIAQLEANDSAMDLKGKLGETEQWLEKYNLSGDETSNREYLLTELQNRINFSSISDIFDNLIGFLSDAFVAVFSILFMTFFFMKDGYLVQKIIFTLTPDKHREKIKSIQLRTHELMSKYLIGVLIQVIITSTIVTSGLLIIGINNAVTIGIIAGIMNLIPYIGPIIGMIIGLIVAITTNLDPVNQMNMMSLILKIVAVFGISQLVDNLFTQPFVLGKSVSAHPLEVFIVISAAGTLAGIGGMIIAIPLYTIMKIIASEFLSGFKVVKSLTRSVSESSNVEKNS